MVYLVIEKDRDDGVLESWTLEAGNLWEAQETAASSEIHAGYILSISPIG